MTDRIRILRRPEVERRTGLSRSTLYERMTEGHFPRPIRLGPRAVGWIESEVDAWLAAQSTQRGVPSADRVGAAG